MSEFSLMPPPRTRIEEIRLQRGFRSAELARRAGMQPPTLFKVQSGETGLTRTWAGRLASALMVSPEQLYAPIGAEIPWIVVRDEMSAIEDRPYSPDHAPPAIGARLRAVLTDTKLETPERLAEMIGAAVPDIFDWIEGRTAPPPRMMNRLAMRAGVTMAWIFYGDETDLLPGVADRLRSAMPKGD